MKKLPIGSQTFVDIVETGYYVDKTKFIEKLASIGKYFFLARPRRFGKSSFLNTLKEAFKGNKNLFRGLHLENHWDWSKKYPIVYISFGGGVTQSVEDIHIVIHEILNDIARSYNIQFKNESISGKFKELIKVLYFDTKEKVVILIDEYDKPILDVIDKEDIALKVRDELKNLYSVIKDSDAHVQFVFITGVSKFSKVNLFSGLNNLLDITLDPEFSTICGYTQNELVKVFQNRLEGVSLDTVKEWYNGYNFLGEKVYNPYDILLYLQSKIFKNYWFQTGTPSFLIKLIDMRKYNVPEIESIQLSETSLDSFDVGSIELETLLFQTGYLTIKDVKTQGIMILYNLEYPNIEVKHSLSDTILKYLCNLNTEKEKNKSKLYEILQNSKLEALKQLFHSFFASIPYNWYIQNTMANYEGYYASIFYCYFSAIGVEVKVEDATNHGRIDMSVIFHDRCYVFEFKVNEITGNGRAMKQLKTRKYHEKYVGYKSTHIGSGTVKEIYLVGVEFSKTDRNITGFEWEKVV